jgi:predicted glycosyltransferase
VGRAVTRVFFYVQHLLGIGHVVRAARICHGLRQAGFAVELVLGGVPNTGLDLTGLSVMQLPPLKAAAGTFRELLTEKDEPATPEMKAVRRGALLAALERADPHVLLIEAFPFARRQMRFELLPLLQSAWGRSPRPLIVSSIRDVLQESRKPGRAEETIDLLRRYFDHVIVHGAHEIFPLATTFPLAHRIADMTAYSGLVGPEPGLANKRGSNSADVIVSAGGGAVGRRLLETAIETKPHSALADARWLVVTGPNASEADCARLARGAGRGVVIERFVPDLAGLLRSATLSISQGGYNTAADILATGCRAVLVPFAAGGQTEQARRAALLETRGFAVVLAEAAFSPETLARAIDRALALPPPVPLNFDGAARTAAILQDLLARRR